MIEAFNIPEATFRQAINAFLQERMAKPTQNKLDRSSLIEKFSLEVWVADAAKRVRQLQVATHTVKSSHPDAKGTSVRRSSSTKTQHVELGSHVLCAANLVEDIVGNAAIFDVATFLRLEVEGLPMLHWVQERDAALLAVLSSDPAKAAELIDAFCSVLQPRIGDPISHSRAKQVFWQVGADAVNDDAFHLLAPLSSSSLAHVIYQVIDGHRFDEAAKAARQAHKQCADHPNGHHVYLHLAIQKLGGSKPQNISYLNKERHGDNYLLASLPPSWKLPLVREPWSIESVFERRFPSSKGARPLIHDLRDFLLSRPPSNVKTRLRVQGYIDALIGELIMFAADLQAGLPAGWTADSRCRLVLPEQLWLDPGRAALDDEFRDAWLANDWPEEIGKRFGHCLNAQLGSDLPVGDAEHRHWRRELQADEETFGWAWQLDWQHRELARQTKLLKGEA